MNADASGLQVEVLQQFVSKPENIERLAVGCQQLIHLVQQLRECVTMLSQ